MKNGAVTGDVVVFVCGAPKERCSTLACRNIATSSCTFELRGRKAGEKCGRALCVDCNKEGLCVPHKRFTDSQSAR
jgi:hypothetical protein